MTSEKLVIPYDRPLAARRIIDALNSGPKLNILKILLEEKENGATAGEIANRLKIKLPTALSHLNDLVKSGLVIVKNVKEGRKTLKKYFLAAKTIALEINLEFFLRLDEKSVEEELKEIEVLAIEYINRKRESSILPLAISVKNVAETLGVDTNTAIKIVDYINTYTDKIIEYLVGEALEVMKKKKKISNVRELAKTLRVHDYWAALIVQKMVSKGYAYIESSGEITLLAA